MSGPVSDPAGGPLDAPPGSEVARDDHWQRLDPRMLLVHPLRELLRFLPFVVVAFVAGSANGGGDDLWHWLAVAVPVALGLLRYLTTGFRISGGRVELRHGLLNRHVTTAPVDRVRTVNLTASPIHRVLGLSTVKIGTGTSGQRENDGLDLDALPTARARELRRELLRQAREDTSDVGPVGAAEPDVVVRFQPRWLLYAPLTSSGVVIAAALVGTLSQVVTSAGEWDGALGWHIGWVTSWWLVALVVAVGLLVVVSGLAVAGYALTNWGFTLTRSREGSAPSWELRRGLLTTRETSLDADRLRGVVVARPLGLRLAGAARLLAVVSGLDRRDRTSGLLVPPAPYATVAATARTVLGAAAALDGPLVGHGPHARTRRFTRALVPAALVAVALVAVVLATGLPDGLVALAVLPLVVATALALDRWRALGHRLDHGASGGWLTVQHGSLARRRTVLQTTGVIGWTWRATWFQRRVGLVTLVATTSGGRQAYAALDIPAARAVRVADQATPGLLTPFLEAR